MNYAVIAASIKKTIIGRKTKLIIAALLLAVSSAFAQVPPYVPTNGLVGWWPFNGNANDESGNGYNGTVNGATLTSDRLLNSNSSYSFDGVSNRIDLTNSQNFSFAASDFTINIWYFSTHMSGNNRHAIRNINYQTGTYYELSPENSINGLPSFGYIGGGPMFEAFSNGLIVDNSIWHMMTGMKKANFIYFYLDGNIQDSVNVGTTTTGVLNSLQVGSFYFNNGSGSVSHKIDDIGIWNRALSQQEITALYNSQTCNSSSNTITADGPTTFCAGNFVNLKSDVVGGTYQWRRNGVNISTNATSRTFKASLTGSYTCVATCNGTALTSNAIAVTSKTNASASVTASGATSFCAGDSVTLNCTNLGSNYSVQWYRTNVSMENATAYSQVVKQPGTYKVVTKNLTNGCSRISGSSAIVAVNCRLANPDVIAADITESDFAAKGINEEPKGKIYIYPNPTSDNKFTVELMGLEIDGNATLEVYNAMGQILFSEKVNITNGTLNRTIQIDEQSKGQLCLVRLIAGSEVYDSKVILK